MQGTTKKNLIYGTAAQTGMLLRDSKKCIEKFLELVAEEINACNKIEIRGFGTFRSRVKASGGRNPRTGEKIVGKPRIHCSFKYYNKCGVAI